MAENSKIEMTPGKLLDILKHSDATLNPGFSFTQPRELFEGVQRIELLQVNSEGNLEFLVEWPKPADP